MDPGEFTSVHILDRVPAIFESRRQYAEWRRILGAGLGVDPLCLVVVGSTAVGVSLSPKKDKLFRTYHDESDVDVGVISPRHFDEAWRFLRSLGPLDQLKTRAGDMADLLQWHRRSLVFDGTIATERLLPHLSYGPDWLAALGRAALIEPTHDRTINVRVYRDFDSLREYHRANVEALRTELLIAAATMEAETASIPEGRDE